MVENISKSSLEIVIVDDSAYLRRYISNTLEEAGFYIVGQAANAEEGIRLSATSSANLFIVDILMPKKSGIDLLQAMSENNYKGYFIVTSSLTTDNIVVEAFRCGAIDFLRKPFERDSLIKSVKKVSLLSKGEKS